MIVIIKITERPELISVIAVKDSNSNVSLYQEELTLHIIKVAVTTNVTYLL
jgi:hypothetical protein